MALIWLWLALIVANFYPLWDGGVSKIWTVLRGQNVSSSETSSFVEGITTPESEKEVAEKSTGVKIVAEQA